MAEVEEEVIRIYVSKKVDPALLDLKNLIPKEVEGVPTDVVEIGEIKALNLHPLAHVTRVRPLVAGVNIGNWAITAGTLGWFFKDGRGNELLGSNAHVFAEDPLKPSSSEKRIVQPISSHPQSTCSTRLHDTLVKETIRENTIGQNG